MHSRTEFSYATTTPETLVAINKAQATEYFIEPKLVEDCEQNFHTYLFTYLNERLDKDFMAEVFKPLGANKQLLSEIEYVYKNDSSYGKALNAEDSITYTRLIQTAAYLDEKASRRVTYRRFTSLFIEFLRILIFARLFMGRSI